VLAVWSAAAAARAMSRSAAQVVASMSVNLRLTPVRRQLFLQLSVNVALDKANQDPRQQRIHAPKPEQPLRQQLVLFHRAAIVPTSRRVAYEIIFSMISSNSSILDFCSALQEDTLERMAASALDPSLASTMGGGISSRVQMAGTSAETSC